jgi:glutamate-1-semialdehyde aminotransferase
MFTAVTAAVIAAVVSVTVAAGSVAVTYLSTRASLQRDHDRQEAELRRDMTARLYDRRVAVYPRLFQITVAFRNSRLNNAADLRSHLAEALAQVDEWHATEGGLMLSDSAYRHMIELRRAVRRYISEPEDSSDLEQLKHDIWLRKGQLRTAMRADLGLLFDEDQHAPD